jgi:hypothetical protein
MKVSKHHYAMELAKRGNKVYFLNPPKEGKIRVSEVSENLFVINLPHYRMLNRMSIGMRKPFHRVLAKKLAKITGVTNFDVVWSFNPFILQNLEVFGASVNIYHPVDLHFSELDLQIAAKCDYLFCTSDAILERYSHVKVPKYQINHGLSSVFLDVKNNCDEFIVENGKKRFAYVGNLQSRFLQFDVLSQVVVENPDVDFYFIGPERKSNFGEFKTFDYSALKELDHTHFLGVLESAKLAEILACFDGFIVSYHSDNPVYLSNLHKTLEYLSTGKVVVTNYIDQYKGSDLIAMVDEIDQLPEKFKEVVANIEVYNTEDLIAKRIEFAHQNTYPHHVDRIESIVVENTAKN